MSENSLINEINKNGLVFTHRLAVNNIELENLMKDDAFETIISAGINYMNGDFCYIKKKR